MVFGANTTSTYCVVICRACNGELYQHVKRISKLNWPKLD